jgi:formate hydrogenlyase subunit 4
VLEYSGRHLAMIELAAALKLTLYIAMIICVFLPAGMANGSAQPVPDIIGGVVWLAKIAVAGIALGIAETSVAKMRVFRVPNFLGAALMLGLLGVLLLFVSRGM